MVSQHNAKIVYYSAGIRKNSLKQSKLVLDDLIWSLSLTKLGFTKPVSQLKTQNPSKPANRQAQDRQTSLRPNQH